MDPCVIKILRPTLCLHSTSIHTAMLVNTRMNIPQPRLLHHFFLRVSAASHFLARRLRLTAAHDSSVMQVHCAAYCMHGQASYLDPSTCRCPAHIWRLAVRRNKQIEHNWALQLYITPVLHESATVALNISCAVFLLTPLCSS